MGGDNYEKDFHCKACGIICPFKVRIRPCATCQDAAPNAETRAQGKWGEDIEFIPRKNLLSASFVEDVFRRGTNDKLGTIRVSGGSYSAN